MNELLSLMSYKAFNHSSSKITDNSIDDLYFDQNRGTRSDADANFQNLLTRPSEPQENRNKMLKLNS